MHIMWNYASHYTKIVQDENEECLVKYAQIIFTYVLHKIYVPNDSSIHPITQD